MDFRWTRDGPWSYTEGMKSLIRGIVTLAILAGCLILFANWQEQRDQEERERVAQELEARRQAERRQATEAYAAQQAARQRAPAPAPAATRDIEAIFRRLARENQVEVLSYRSAGGDQVDVSLRTRRQTGIGDLLDASIREGILLDFDDSAMTRNSRMTSDRSTGARITTTSTRLRVR